MHQISIGTNIEKLNMLFLLRVANQNNPSPTCFPVGQEKSQWLMLILQQAHKRLFKKESLYLQRHAAACYDDGAYLRGWAPVQHSSEETS